MKKLSLLFICILILNSCKEEKLQKKITTTVKKETVNASLLEKDRLSEAEIEEKKKGVNHLFVANGGSILYMKNGDLKGAARFDTDGDFVGELLQMDTYGKYKDYDNYVIGQHGDTTYFFNESGRIISDWEILKGVSVENDMQVMSFISPKNENSNDTEIINTTKLIIFRPEIKTFTNEDSPEAEAYFTAMDDWNYYSHELNEYFKKMKVETLYAKKRYLKLEIEDGKKITIDTKGTINNYHAHCILYKKNKRPVLVYLLVGDNEESEIRNYLN
ncbi:hypothetical protein [Flavobacterium sp. RS13.1]|uniref:hypothetical protein n=1 Tax=Flavobacterium sp. RS13.1 TaxID=3400345 RepID=UPI003AAC69C5